MDLGQSNELYKELVFYLCYFAAVNHQKFALIMILVSLLPARPHLSVYKFV